MKKIVVVILITFHLINSSLYATNSFLEKNHVHQHSHSHNSSLHQHKHSHSQANISFVDFFTDTQDIDSFEYPNVKQRYLETISFVSNHTLDSLFHPPKI